MKWGAYNTHGDDEIFIHNLRKPGGARPIGRLCHRSKDTTEIYLKTLCEGME
jgi:hypothetical protein